MKFKNSSHTTQNNTVSLNSIEDKLSDIPLFGNISICFQEMLFLESKYNKTYPFIPLDGKGYYIIESLDKGKLIRATNAMEWINIKGVSDDNNGKCSVNVEIRKRTVNIPREGFIPSEFLKLNSYGIRISTDYVKELSKGINKLLSMYDIVPQNRIVGFKYDQNDIPMFEGYNGDAPLLKITSSISEDEYINSLNTLLTNTDIGFAMACACASMFLAFLRIFCKVALNSFVISFVGRTSTGKSTAQMLMASVYTSPSDETVMRSFYGTENALIKLLDNKMGVPMMFDETTITGKSDMGKLIYQISLGRGKARCTTNAELKQSGEWYTIVSTSSETANLDTQKMHKGGLDSRNLGFEDLCFTDDASHSEKIKEFSINNYGILGRKLSEYILGEGTDKIKAEYTECMHELVAEIGVENMFDISDRLIANYALIVIAAKTLKAFGINIDVAGTTEIIVNNHNHIAAETNIAERYYGYIVAYIAAHPLASFIKDDNMHKGCVDIISVNFEEILTNCGNTEIKLVLDSLEKAGYLIRGKGEKLTEKEKNSGKKSNTTKKARRRFNKTLTDCYIIKLPEEERTSEEISHDSTYVDAEVVNCFENYEEEPKP